MFEKIPPLQLYNSLSKKEEVFVPISTREVLMYTCGPTVYNSPHIGNYRAYIFADSLRRTLVALGYNVKQVINLTDVDDKTIKKSQELGITLEQLGKKYEEEFYIGREALSLLPAYRYPRATDYINEMQKIILQLLDKRFAYKTEDGSIYFKVASDPDYGQLVHIDKNEIKENAGGRMTSDEYEKDSIQDFALWKAWEQTDGVVGWNFPLKKPILKGLFGFPKDFIHTRGRPGWHIECSAMARATLGESIDIHTGGVDNMFPHHENEIAQSECANGKKFSNFFVHSEHLLVDGKKMAKRDGNVYSLDDLKNNGIHSLAYKLFLYQTHYRSPANFTWDAVNGAQTLLRRMYEKFALLLYTNIGNVDQSIYKQFLSKMVDNLNTAEAISNFNLLIDNITLIEADKLATILACDKVLGLGFDEYYTKNKHNFIHSEISEIVKERNMARENKDYLKSDKLRLQLNQKGYMVIDTKDGSIVAIDPLF